MNKEIILGSYNNTPVKWIVLEEDDESLTLLSKYILEIRRYDIKTTDYEKSEIKDFLENYMKSRFNIEIENIYLLSNEEAENYLPNIENKRAYLEPSKYGKHIRYSWWLRSPDNNDTNHAYYIEGDGIIYYYDLFYLTYNGIRPACRVLKSKIKQSKEKGSKELLTIVKKDGHCNIDFRVTLNKLTREEFNETVKMAYYALKALEENSSQEIEVWKNE